MAKSSMGMLIHLANDSVEKEERRLGSLNIEKTRSTDQLSMLKQYREDYTNRLLESSRSGLTMANYHNFYRFINTLDKAITQQSASLEQVDHKLENQKKQWLEARQRQNAYQTLQDRRDQAHIKQQTRQEQRVNDELSAAMHYRLHHLN